MARAVLFAVRMSSSRTNGQPKRGHREQVAELVDVDDVRPLDVHPLPSTDRLHNPDDITVDEAAIDAGVTHGGTLETHAESMQVRGNGGRKRSAARSRHHSGRDLSKPRR